MSETNQKQMYIITAECYKCDGKIKVAMIRDGLRNGFCGPEAFSIQERKLAEDNGVLIQQQRSYTMDQTYDANTCHHCNAFIGQHYLFTDYFVEAECGDYEYKTINING